MANKRLIISGRVQGVGYREWAVEAARRLGLSGWIRNRRDGSVEMLLAGEVSSVEEMVRHCRRGPRHAEVAAIDEFVADLPDEDGFHRRPTA